MINKILEIKRKLGKDLLILAHHYQSDDIIKLADYVGDSLKLAKEAESNKEAKYIIFCGVHFMAETADILTEKNQKVFMPDTNAGCPMADMAELTEAEKAWNTLTNIFGDTILPITYINSRAEIKSFCGKHGGTTVTSSNAKKIVSWGLNQKERILFLPDQNLGKNTAVSLGIKLSEIAVYNKNTNKLEYDGDYNNIKVILWNGYCHVHHKIPVEKIENVRNNYDNMQIIVHPECRYEVTSLADKNGSTEFIINEIKNSPSGSKWAVGTERNLVNRLIKDFPDKEIIILDENSSCSDMDSTKPESLLNTLEQIIDGNFEKQIKVDDKVSKYAKKALDTMLNIK